MAQAATPQRGVYATLAVPAPFDTTFSLVTSPVFSPLGLAVARLTLAFYGTVFLIVRLVYDGVKLHTDKSFFSYFTDLSYIGLVAYFWAAGVQTACFARNGRYPLQRWPRLLQFLHLLLISTIFTFPIVVTIVFWSLLSSPDTFKTRYSAWSNTSEHALNTVFAVSEILFSNIAPRFASNPKGLGLPWIHLPFLILMLGGYLGVAYITHATQGFYTYSFLDPEKEHAKLAVYIVGIALAELIIFVIFRYVAQLRAYLFIRTTHRPKRFSKISEADAELKAEVEALEEWEEVDRPSAASGATGVAV